MERVEESIGALENRAARNEASAASDVASLQQQHDDLVPTVRATEEQARKNATSILEQDLRFRKHLRELTLHPLLLPDLGYLCALSKQYESLAVEAKYVPRLASEMPQRIAIFAVAQARWIAATATV